MNYDIQLQTYTEVESLTKFLLPKYCHTITAIIILHSHILTTIPQFHWCTNISTCIFYSLRHYMI